MMSGLCNSEAADLLGILWLRLTKPQETLDKKHQEYGKIVLNYWVTIRRWI